MQARSPAFDAAVIAGAVPIVTATVSYGGTATRSGLPILAGATVTVDSAAAVRRTLRCQVPVFDNAGVLLVPTGPTSLLAPFGTELAINVGFVGVADTVPQGIFRIDDVVSDSAGLINIAGSDRASVISEAKFESPYVIPFGDNIVTHIGLILAGHYPGTLTTSLTASSRTALAPVVFKEGDDPWKACQDLAADLGMELFIDVYGTAVLRPIVNPTLQNVVWSYAPGPGGLLTKVTHRMSSRGVKNIALVIGENTGVVAPVRATAEVTDSNNAIYPSGAFGRRPDVTVSTTIGLVPDAQAAADARLLQVAGTGEITQFSAVPHPAHDAGDVVRITHPTLGVDVLAVLSHFSTSVGLDKETVYDTVSAKRAQ